MSIDYEREYNNRARVPENPGIIASWASDSAAYREQKPPRVVRYGEGERHTFDFFEAGDGPAVMYIHGGYWQALDKSFHSIHARGLNARGISVAVPSYDLCPNVRLGDIVENIRAACLVLARETGQPMVVSGHSAGGHLAACMLATEAHVPAAYAISGLFDLKPLIPTTLNGALRLDDEEAENLSPLFWPAPEGKSLDAVVGEVESGEFHRQSDDIVRAWGENGVSTRRGEVEGANHFTVIAPLTDADSEMVQRLAELAKGVR
ncbi:alpha/beta hydrolase [Terricaulis sp.]|uniref:alpha/beta hydrolase n=1 Tax=Terricaulis sp. TaxID=2768686 RepID=UPI003784FD9F